MNISVPGVLEGLGLMLSGDPGLGRGVSPGKGPGPGAPPRGNWSPVSGGATPPATPPGSAHSYLSASSPTGAPSFSQEQRPARCATWIV